MDVLVRLFSIDKYRGMETWHAHHVCQYALNNGYFRDLDYPTALNFAYTVYQNENVDKYFN